MNAFDQKRRSFLFSVGVLGMSQVLPQSVIGTEAAARQGYVLGATEGENLVHFRDHGKISIKVGSATGSANAENRSLSNFIEGVLKKEVANKEAKYSKV